MIFRFFYSLTIQPTLHCRKWIWSRVIELSLRPKASKKLEENWCVYLNSCTLWTLFLWRGRCSRIKGYESLSTATTSAKMEPHFNLDSTCFPSFRSLDNVQKSTEQQRCDERECGINGCCCGSMEQTSAGEMAKYTKAGNEATKYIQPLQPLSQPRYHSYSRSLSLP